MATGKSAPSTPRSTDTFEIERIGRVAFDLARVRRNKVTSMEKHNVMRTGVLWKDVMTAVHARHYGDVELRHMLRRRRRHAAGALSRKFDVIVTDNLFGDILSDVAAMLTGSLGMLPSASLGAPDAKGRRKALYERCTARAPDIAGKGVANPIAAILSFAMCLRYSLGTRPKPICWSKPWRPRWRRACARRTFFRMAHRRPARATWATPS